MMAEIYGKATGVCKGKGGSMHIADMSRGMLGANGIVGGGPPLACGAGLMAKVQGTDQVAACFFGDGASNQGTTLEAMNLAGVWKLPVIFICENNRYAETTSADYAVSGSDIAARARGFGMPGVTVDGQNVFAMHEAAREAVDRARRGEGPAFIEAQTYRYFGHVEGDTGLYRTKEEVEFYRSQDCIQHFRKTVLEDDLLGDAELDAVDRQVKDAMEEAIRFAAESPQPAPEETFTDVYVDFPATEIWPFRRAAV